MSKQTEKNTNPRYRTGIDKFGLVALILLAVCSMALFVRLLATNMLTTTYTVVIMVALIIINGVHLIIQLPLWRNKLPKLICGIVAIILSAAMIYGVVAVSSLQNALSNMTGNHVENDVTAIMVMTDDPAEDPSDTAGYTYGILANSDKENTDALLEHLQSSIGTVTTRAYETPFELVDALYDDEVQAIILNEGYIDVVKDTEGYENFTQQTRIIYEFTTTREVDPITPTGAITKDPFVVYLSGSDARSGNINVRTRSDSNILAFVNPKTHQVLLLSTPRDTYLPLASNGQMDKLTHAGLGGIEQSIHTLENFYDSFEVSYYARINFYGLVDLVDAVGGVDVYSKRAFTTDRLEVPGQSERVSFSYQEGWNHVNGQQALLFARERHAFADGDYQRGRNQMTVIKAILKKLTSPAILANYQGVLNAVKDNTITNFSYDDLTSLVQLQLKDMPDWNIQTYDIDGTGDMKPCYYAGGAIAWVSWPDQSTVSTAKELIRQVMEGEILAND